jgi:cysteine desulfuration protein SufE
MKKSIEELEHEIVEEFSFLSEWGQEQQQEYIIEQGCKLKGFPEGKKTAENEIKGCQSKVWLDSHLENGNVFFNADSNSFFVKGIIALLIRVLSGQNPDDILNAKLDFINTSNLKRLTSMNRVTGLGAMIKRLKESAMNYKLQSGYQSN